MLMLIEQLFANVSINMDRYVCRRKECFFCLPKIVLHESVAQNTHSIVLCIFINVCMCE